MIDWRQSLPVGLISALVTGGGVVLLAYPSDFAADPVNQFLVASVISISTSLLVLFGLRVLGVSDRGVRWVIPVGVLTTVALLVIALQLAGMLWGSLLTVVVEFFVLVVVDPSPIRSAGRTMTR